MPKPHRAPSLVLSAVVALSVSAVFASAGEAATTRAVAKPPAAKPGLFTPQSGDTLVALSPVATPPDGVGTLSLG